MPRPRSRLDSVVEATSAWVAVFSAGRELRLISDGLSKLGEHAADSLLGLVADYGSEADTISPQGFVDALCPPSSAFEGGFAQRPAVLPVSSGGSVACELTDFPLPDSSGIGQVLVLAERFSTTSNFIAPSSAVKLHAELAAIRQELRQRYGFRTLIGTGSGMHRVFLQARLAIQSNAPVCIIGERGTGREHLARVIHGEVDNPARVLVPIDCQRTPKFELEQTLQRLLELEPPTSVAANTLHPRTLLLKNVEHLPRDIQDRLVTHLQRDDRQPLRLISISSQRPQQWSKSESCKQAFIDLATTLVIPLPPLRERLDDLMPLAQYFLERDNRNSDKTLTGLSEATAAALREYQWHGNVTELAQVIAEARVSCDGPIIEPAHLPFHFRSAMDAQTVGPHRAELPIEPLEELLARTERDHIQFALDQCDQNRTEAAKRLGIPRAKLYRRIEALGLDGDAQ